MRKGGRNTEATTGGKGVAVGEESSAEATAFDLATVCRYAADFSPLALLAVEGPTHLVRYANPALLRLSGKGAEEIIGLPFSEAVPEGFQNGCEPMLDRVFQGGVTETLHHQQHETPFSGVYWSYTAWAIAGSAKRPMGVMVQIADTSALQKAQQQITAVNEALMVHGLEQQELDDALTQREQAVRLNESLTATLREKNDLMNALNVRLKRSVQETHHRVKNNLQIVAALAELQMDGGSTVPTAALERIATHVRTLASLHDVLTLQVRGNEPSDSVDSAVSLEQLAALLQTAVGSRRIVAEIAPVTLTIQKSASLSLLVSELVSNAAKHGAGDIAITLTQDGAAAQLTVSDTGNGFPEDFDPAAGVSTGMELIASLARHGLAGVTAFTNLPDGGASVVVTFPA